MRWQSVSSMHTWLILNAASLVERALQLHSGYRGKCNMRCTASDSMQVVRWRSYTRLRKKVASRAFIAKPGFLACLQRSAGIACKMQVHLACMVSCLLKKLISTSLIADANFGQ